MGASTARAEEPPAAAHYKIEDFLIAPVRVHLLCATKEPALCTTLENADIERILKKVNRIWAQAGITFYLESIVREQPADSDAAPPGKDGNLRALLSFMPPASHGD